MRKFLNDIPIGRENAISRQGLMVKWGLSDREVRRRIAGLRTFDDGSNMVIVSDSRGGGYFRSNNLPDIQHFVAEMLSRTGKINSAVAIAKCIELRLEQKERYGEGLV